jgi:hypothetical protein
MDRGGWQMADTSGTGVDLIEVTRHIWTFALIGAAFGLLLPNRANRHHVYWRALLFLTLLVYGICLCFGNLTAVGGLSSRSQSAMREQVWRWGLLGIFPFCLSLGTFWHAQKKVTLIQLLVFVLIVIFDALALSESMTFYFG